EDGILDFHVTGVQTCALPISNYLRLRADALVTDEYRPSDLAWMDVKTNPVELVIGAIETYEDRLFGYKAAYESYVLLKDMEWSEIGRASCRDGVVVYAVTRAV